MRQEASDLECEGFRSSHSLSASGGDRAGRRVPNRVLPLARLNASLLAFTHLLCVMLFAPTGGDNGVFW